MTERGRQSGRQTEHEIDVERDHCLRDPPRHSLSADDTIPRRRRMRRSAVFKWSSAPCVEDLLQIDIYYAQVSAKIPGRRDSGGNKRSRTALLELAKELSRVFSGRLGVWPTRAQHCGVGESPARREIEWMKREKG